MTALPGPALPPRPQRPPSSAVRPGVRPAGHTRIATQALSSVAQGVAGQVLDVPPSAVRVGLHDEFGSLALVLSLPMPLRPLAAPQPLPPVWKRARDARKTVRERFTALTGAHVGRVDVRVTGILPETVRRPA
ncbi:hypothetical protein NCCP1664_26180 [Zafaria cholistanensis]|uniref:Uncharacterized protein n=1 Tax=Zafaria cholistanensis TaxID=1682741 RepID=A0A5A7NTK7_9MICC|nr:hypothetical protein [Zafaria cholistanensis]GER24123.1 hypothetical protein NCCP1664_26180 [Zafaria cholistanensis]